MTKQIAIWFAGAFLLGLGLVIGTQLDRFSGAGSRGSSTTAMPTMTDDAPVYRSGPFKVSVAVNPEAPTIGDNRLMIKVMDTQGNPVPDARIQAFGQMAAMGAMPAMRAPANLKEVAPGEYAGPMNLEMSGEWPLSVSIKEPGRGETALRFEMATGRPGLQLVSGGVKIAQAGEDHTSQDAAEADAGKPTYRAGSFKLSVDLEPRTPRVGKNELTISLRDNQGNPVSDARIRAIAEMPAMGAMPAMQAQASVEETSPGEYVGAFGLSMSGEWPLSIEIQKEGMGSQRVTFDMATGRPGLQVVSGAVAEGQNGMQSMQMEEAPPGTIMVDSQRRQLIGVETGEVEYRDLVRDIRAVGRVIYDETRLSDVNLRFDAWVGELMADYVGKSVKQGEALFTVYGPELLAAQREYLEVLRSRSGQTSGLTEAARKRLLLFDMTLSQIEELESRGEPLDYVPILAPRSGTVVAKEVVTGTANPAGTTLMRIADLSQVWVEAEVYEGEVPLVEEGMPALITLPYLPGKMYEARVEYVYPYLQSMTRTGRVRVTLNNPDGVLKPDMYAEVKLKADLGRRLVVPEEAVVFAGESRIVFEDLGGGRLAPRKVRTGARNQGYIEILEGLEAGDQVVTSGNFLIASETRLKAGIEQW
ncbi:MAG: efflux RND transporter periplasmic adaptor subunit [Gammaproteobacteria bacterium]